jgi:RNA polymerase sigma-B factor
MATALLSRIKRDISEEETMQLFREYCRTRAKRTRDQLVELHYNLVRFLAGKFANRGEPTEDLVQVGMIGLINAIDRYDPDRGTKFSTYATPTIVGEIRRHFRDKAWSLKVPRRLQELNLAATKAEDNLAKSLGRPPTIQEIAVQIGASEEETLEAIELGNAYDTVSLDAKLAREGESAPLTLAEFIGDVDPRLSAMEQYGDLTQAIDQLEPREKAIIHYRFYMDMSQTEVAKRLNISQMHVSRLQQKALRALRAGLSGNAKALAVLDAIAAEDTDATVCNAAATSLQQRPEKAVQVNAEQLVVAVGVYLVLGDEHHLDDLCSRLTRITGLEPLEAALHLVAIRKLGIVCKDDDGLHCKGLSLVALPAVLELCLNNLILRRSSVYDLEAICRIIEPRDFLTYKVTSRCIDYSPVKPAPKKHRKRRCSMETDTTPATESQTGVNQIIKEGPKPVTKSSYDTSNARLNHLVAALASDDAAPPPIDAISLSRQAFEVAFYATRELIGKSSGPINSAAIAERIGASSEEVRQIIQAHLVGRTSLLYPAALEGSYHLANTKAQLEDIVPLELESGRIVIQPNVVSDLHVLAGQVIAQYAKPHASQTKSVKSL